MGSKLFGRFRRKRRRDADRRKAADRAARTALHFEDGERFPARLDIGLRLLFDG
jgi:hypothetical protein